MIENRCWPGRTIFSARAVLTLCAVLALTGCTQLFFFPQKELIATPDRLDLEYRDVFFQSADGTRLHGWFLPTQGSAQGTVFFLHGNAENISTHIGSVHWLPNKAMNVFLFDYRGYGRSEGVPDLPGIVADTQAAFAAMLALDETKRLPVVIFGQSLGGALAAYFAANNPHRQRVAGVIIDSAFSDFQRIVREKAGASWVTWALQYPAAWTVSNAYSPIAHIAKISPIPLLVMHSKSDQIIPPHHSQVLYDAAGEPKTLWFIDNEYHIGAMRREEHQERVYAFMADAIATFKGTTRSEP